MRVTLLRFFFYFNFADTSFTEPQIQLVALFLYWNTDPNESVGFLKINLDDTLQVRIVQV